MLSSASQSTNTSSSSNSSRKRKGSHYHHHIGRDTHISKPVSSSSPSRARTSHITKRLRRLYHQYFILENKNSNMRPLPTSDSCCTLVDVNTTEQPKIVNDTSTTLTSSSSSSSSYHYRQDYFLRTHDATLRRTQLELPFSKDTFLSLPSGPSCPSWLVDRYLSSLPAIVGPAETLLESPVISYNKKTKKKRGNFLYVYQREMAHVSFNSNNQDTNKDGPQVLVSDLATTCHILALHSTSSGESSLTSLTHIDGTKYDECIRKMMQTHIEHHHRNKCEMRIHIMGGYQDDTSRDITQWLLHLLANLADDFPSIQMKLETCAVSSINHDSLRNGPIGRGLAIDVQTGNVHLAKVPNVLQEVPAMKLRSCRLWSDDRSRTSHLSVITSKNNNNTITIEPFHYEAFADMDILESLPDEVFLEYTSTSPECEEPEFCSNARITMNYMRTTNPQDMFGPNLHQPLELTYHPTTQQWKRSKSSPLS